MSRQSGSANLAASLEVLAGAPLDARSKVPLKTDLTTASNFPYPYEGMQVYVAEEKKTYTLIGSDVTVLANWQENGSGGGSSVTVDDAMSNSSTNPVQNKVITEALASKADLDSSGKVQITQIPTYSFNDLSNRPTKDVTPMSNVATPLPSVMSRRFKYSTEEQIVGEWIDGKPLYQKTVTGTSPSSATTFSLGLSNVDMVVELRGIVQVETGSNHTYAPIPTGHASNNAYKFYMEYTTETDLLYFGGGAKYLGRPYYITIQYTKTTD